MQLWPIYWASGLYSGVLLGAAQNLIFVFEFLSFEISYFVLVSYFTFLISLFL